MAFVWSGKGAGGTIDHGFVISKHMTLVSDWHAKASKVVPEVNHLLDAGSCRCKLGSAGCSFTRGLLLGIGFNHRLIEEVHCASD